MRGSSPPIQQEVNIEILMALQQEGNNTSETKHKRKINYPLAAMTKAITYQYNTGEGVQINTYWH